MKHTALITGASSGIGNKLARLFAADGHDVVLVARRRRELDELKQELETQHAIKALVLQTDLSGIGAAEDIQRELEKRSIVVDFLVNNAGFGTNGRFADLELRKELEMIQVNLTSCVHLTRLILPGMISRIAGADACARWSASGRASAPGDRRNPLVSPPGSQRCRDSAVGRAEPTAVRARVGRRMARFKHPNRQRRPIVDNDLVADENEHALHACYIGTLMSR